jgi:hypothetical protein
VHVVAKVAVHDVNRILRVPRDQLAGLRGAGLFLLAPIWRALISVALVI